jgi:integrase/recombinase XerD
MSNASALTPTFLPSMREEEIAASAFLSGYSGETRTMYAADLRLFFEWCLTNGLEPLQAQRVHLEFFSDYLTTGRGNAPASVHRRLSTLKGFFRIAVADDRITRDPCVFLRMPKVIYDETRALGLDRMELGSLIQTARATSPRDNALVSLMGLLALRVSEACNVKIEDYAGTERGHRVLLLVGKGAKPATIPLPIPVIRALDACAAGRTTGSLILRKDGQQMDRRTAYRRIESLAKKAGITAKIHPHTLRHSAITAALDAGVPLRDAQVFARHSDPRITTRYDRARLNLDRHASYLVASFIAGAA